MEVPSWLVIGLVTIAVAAAANLLSKKDIRWFKHLRRPKWLTFEKAIPLIWTIVFICGAWSAYIVWEAEPGTIKTWLLMAFYLLVEIAIVAYTPVMCKARSLKVGTIIGGAGFVLGLILALIVLSISGWAFILLLPYLLWSPIGTFVTWQMAKLNPADT
ncbi:TspO and MBR related protein [Stanieria cyanosphaera PCC 7437]|uniref:TspO and MBR related protein n=1 Tax=Stanieria cyanosphaera (strain ATCC 29371 / PCC 7437) TaxID=111780 RepID=K9XWY5_STAC7|nr:TspO/MBR family protein [Stanieria cyanosphaera]AFZ37110.1 TspO and MBR related protein [Stanieria cyanosphaera PCC 7437]